MCVVQVKKVAPLGHRVFVKVGEQETRTEGGVFLPIAAQKRSTQGEIVDAGTAKNLKVGAGGRDWEKGQSHVLEHSLAKQVGRLPSRLQDRLLSLQCLQSSIGFDIVLGGKPENSLGMRT